MPIATSAPTPCAPAPWNVAIRRTDPVTAWLAVCAAMVAMMVVLGGLTRLTGSGLSMVEWNPHHLLPPLSAAEWEEAFALYRATAQFRLVNGTMDLAGFQGIFWLEYVHRLWGRLIGLAFAVPLAWFAWRRLLPAALVGRLALLFLLGAGQGALGWYMVASGLVDRPEVSPFRLAAHLILALALFSALVWTLLDRLPTNAAGADRRTARRLVTALTALAVTVIGWGALVAGLKAGLVHPTFPLMDGGLFPADGLFLSPAWINAVENPAAVQYVHRILAMTLVACLSLGAAWAWLARLTPAARRPLLAAAWWAWVQAGLGIATLLSGVMIPLAALHQSGAVVLIGLLTWSLHRLTRERE